MDKNIVIQLNLKAAIAGPLRCCGDRHSYMHRMPPPGMDVAVQTGAGNHLVLRDGEQLHIAAHGLSLQTLAPSRFALAPMCASICAMSAQ